MKPGPAASPVADRSRLARGPQGDRLHERLGALTLHFQLRRVDDAIHGNFTADAC